jgi:hypothetical protein
MQVIRLKGMDLTIADARQIFHKNFFSFFVRKTSPGSEKKKNYEKFAGRPQ